MSFKFPKWLIVEYISQINTELFNRALPIEELKITQNLKGPDYLALAWDFNIELNPETIQNCDCLFDTLAHELIHIYQDWLEIPNNHNGKFFRYFEEKADGLYDSKIGLTIY